jgi:HEAT repeat protein
MKSFLFVGVGLALLAGGPARAETKASKKVQELLKDLKSPNAKIRIYAVEELGHQAEIRLADAKVAIPALIKAMKDNHPGVRRAVIIALEKVGADPKDLLPGLIDSIKKSMDIPLRITAATTLGNMGPAAKEAVPALQQLEAKLKAIKNPKFKGRYTTLIREIETALRKIGKK